MDPKHIYMRTNSHEQPPPTSIAQRLRVPGRPESPTVESNQPQTGESSNTVDATRDWRKGTSFLSRLSMRTPWAKDQDGFESDSEHGGSRDEGANARAFTAVRGAGGGYIPLHKAPPRYIRVSRNNKKDREFNHMFLAQELCITDPKAEEESGTGRTPMTAMGNKLMKGGAAIWAAEFSMDGKYLAVAGKDKVVRVYAVISTPEERFAHEEDETQEGGREERLSAPVFRKKPVREYSGHTEQVLALSWSKNGFLLSSSMDKTVKLWHTKRADCLCTFQHNDLVTSIAFHPTDDRFFLAGSLDSQLRLWNIPDKTVQFSTTTTEFQTAVGFSPDGTTAICGLLNGMCMFFNTEGLTPINQIHVRSSRGKNAKGSKITGIRTSEVLEGPEKGDVKVLISSNDSRVRIYSLKTRMLESKFRGHVCQSSQISARFGDDARYVICGSEDKRAYIWGPTTSDIETRSKQPYESFDAHPEVVTVALFAPTKSKQLLSASGDPVFDLCNPPPVTLMSLDESQVALSESDMGDNHPHHRSVSMAKKPEESPAYIERSKHPGGSIVITADRTGTIKVFRQDCAYVKRQNAWETGSKISSKVATNMGRSASIRTGTSSRAQSRRGSLSLGSNAHPQPASDRIISWRQNIDGDRRDSRNATPSRSERSLSPHKGKRSSIITSAGSIDSRHNLGYSASVWANEPASPTGSATTSRASVRLGKNDQGSAGIPTPSFSFLSIADAKEGNPSREGGFWNRLRGNSNQGSPGSTSPNSLSPNNQRTGRRDNFARRSLGFNNDIRKQLAAGELKESRRVSSGARLASMTSLGGSTNQSIDEIVELDQTRPKSRQRDSGVGRISAESTDESIKPTS
ncbi:unnamed protein product [Clonostachys rosea]|uniref:Anaphase-promoting complex subunit 4 WD40 domain-containing protein n=1 Tax=Bionectria ochroleuca TaxID=29856 RepID=A0ABY6ULK4_BIOOC|nr:unnamed protein product [Clonostachys rosea]